MSEFLNSANCFSFHVWSYGATLLSGLVGFFFVVFFFLISFYFLVKTEENLELKEQLETYSVHVFSCIKPDLLWKKAMAASAQEILQYFINSLPA